jgi:hypothetical protein
MAMILPSGVGHHRRMSAAEQVDQPRRPAMLIRFLIAGACYAAVAATFASHSLPALVAVLLPGAAVFVLAGRRPRDTAPEPIRSGRLVWLVWAVVFGVWELVALFRDELSFSLLMDPVLEVYPLRLAAWAAWLYAGWLLVRR